MSDQDWLAARFEDHRSRLRATAYRMLGSLAEADEAVQEAWLRVSRASADDVENMSAWLTTIVARLCLNMLRARKARPEDAVGVRVPDPIILRDDEVGPEHAVLLADSVGLALQVVLETLQPAERLAFVLHDMFNLPFDDIAPLIERTPDAARQLASRARRRVQGAATPTPDVDLGKQREVVDAFFAAARQGNFAALVAVLHPDVVLRSDAGPARPEASGVERGASTVARRALMFAQPAAHVRHALVNGAAGVVITAGERTIAVMGFIVSGGTIVEIDAISDPQRLTSLVL